MRIIRALDEYKKTDALVILAAGCFDGLHIGHTAVIQKAIAKAQEINGEAWVFTFEPHPANVLMPDRAPPLIFTPHQQARHLQEMGIAGCILQPFTLDFMKQEPVRFFNSLRDCIPHLAGISVGEDWSFGRNRAGNATLLSELCRDHNLFFSALPEVQWKNERVSSTRIRKAITLGQMNDASGMLGRPVSTTGTVVHGEKIGRKLGYPTANIAPENDMLPPSGIYAARLRVGSTLYNAAAYIGHRATFHTNHPQVLEVHLLDEKEIDLYGQQVEVNYLKYIRVDQVFSDTEKLKCQIVADLAAIRSALD